MLVNEIINARDLPVMEFDGIIVGGGGAGTVSYTHLRAHET